MRNKSKREFSINPNFRQIYLATFFIMLSRRFLRIKVMQSAYAYEIAKQAQLTLIAGEIEQYFAPDLNSMIPQDKEFLSSQANSAKKLFLDSYKNKSLVRSENDEVDTVASKKIKEYYQAEESLKIDIKKRLSADLFSINKSFLSLISIPAQFLERIKLREEKENSMKVSSLGFTSSEYNIQNNRYFKALSQSPSLKTAVLSYKVPLPDPLLVKKIYLSCLENETYKEDLHKETSPEEDLQLMKKIVKIIFKSEFVETEIKEKNLNYQENLEILKGLCLRVLKQELEDISDKDLFSTVLKDEDEDFWKQLYHETLDEDKKVDSLMTEKLKHWDLERVTLTDRIIVKMAIQEMLHHPSVPVKVTINEYIELSKKYSTPKSKQFVNGILDSLSKELSKSGEIKKSGRGLIDNK